MVFSVLAIGPVCLASAYLSELNSSFKSLFALAKSIEKSTLFLIILVDQPFENYLIKSRDIMFLMYLP
jgi:hypothetical protein